MRLLCVVGVHRPVVRPALGSLLHRPFHARTVCQQCGRTLGRTGQ